MVGGLVGLALAVAGAFAGWPVVAVGASAAVVAGWWFARPGLRRTAGAGAALAVVVLAVGSAAFGVHHRSNHLLTDRDPGVYAVTGLWTAATGGLVVDDGLVDAGLADATSGTDDALGFHDAASDHSARPQFPHLFPTYLAVAADVGTTGLLFAVPPLFGGLALLAVFALGRELVRPWPAAVATALLAATMPQLHLSRDVLSELPAQALLFGGLWAIAVAWRRRHVPMAALGGLLLGAGVGVRLDLALGLLAVVLLDAAARRQPDLRPVRTAAVVGAAVGAVVCAVDLALRSPRYVRELGAESAALLAVVGVAVLVTRVVLPWLERRRPGWVHAVVAPERRRRLADAAAGAVVLVVAYLWLVRPHVVTVRQGEAAIVGALQAADGVAVDPTRRYWERSMEWVAWYLGVPALVLGAAGWAVLSRQALLRCEPARRVLALVFGVGALLALVRPSISPDHLWAMRRYLPLVLPGLCLCAAVAVEAAAARWVPHAPGRRSGAVPAAVLALAGIPAVAVSWSTADARVQAGVVGLVAAACETVGDDAVLVVEDDSFTEELAAMPLRVTCELPVAAVGDGADVDGIAAAARAAGLDPVAAELRYEGSEPRPLVTGGPEVILTAVDGNRLDSTIVRAPSRTGSTTWQLILAPLDPPAS